MLPSRSLRWSGHAINTGRRRLTYVPATSRHFASAIPKCKLQLPSQTSQHPLRFHRPSWQTRGTRYISPSLSKSTLRCASSTSTSTTSQLPTSASLPSSTDTFTTTSLDHIGELTSSDLAAIPEQIGYLKTLGLDYGWGPTAFIETLLEHIHIYTGTPWWASILLTAVAVRLALIKPYIAAADVSARIASIQPITTPIRDKMLAAQRAGDQQGMLLARQELQGIHKKAGVKAYRAFIPLVQVPLGFGTFRLFRGMATLPVPGLEQGGFLWVKDLTVGDPYFILPIATAGAFYLVMRKGGETGSMLLSPQMQKAMTYGLPTVTGVFALAWPGAMQLTFFATSALSMIQAALFRNPSFRQWLGIYPLPVRPITPTTGGSETPKTTYDGTMTMYQAPNVAAPATEQKKGLIGGAMSEIRGMKTEALKSMQKVVGKSSATSHGRRKRAAAEIKQAWAYEERRRKEIAQEKIQRDLARSRSKVMKESDD